MYSGQTGFEHQAQLVNSASDAGVKLRLGVEVNELSRSNTGGGPFQLCVQGLLDSDGLVSSRAVVLATGSAEPDSEFPGSDLHGVMRSGDAQVAVNVRGQLVGRRFVMSGADNTGLLIARNLLDAGADVVAVLEEGARVEGREFNAAPLRQAGVEILTSTRLVEAAGHGKLERVRIQSTEPPDAPVRDIEADTLCLAWPRAPESQLAVDAECPVLDIGILGGYVPVHDREFSTPVAGLFVCGDASGVESGATAMETGRLAGLAASRYLGYSHRETDALSKLARGRLGYLRRGRRGALRREAKARLNSQHRNLTN